MALFIKNLIEETTNNIYLDAVVHKYCKDEDVVQVQQLASKDTDRSWVGFKDSTGKHKLILTNYLK